MCLVKWLGVFLGENFRCGMTEVRKCAANWRCYCYPVCLLKSIMTISLSVDQSINSFTECASVTVLSSFMRHLIIVVVGGFDAWTGLLMDGDELGQTWISLPWVSAILEISINLTYSKVGYQLCVCVPQDLGKTTFIWPLFNLLLGRLNIRFNPSVVSNNLCFMTCRQTLFFLSMFNEWK